MISPDRCAVLSIAWINGLRLTARLLRVFTLPADKDVPLIFLPCTGAPERRFGRILRHDLARATVQVDFWVNSVNSV